MDEKTARAILGKAILPDDSLYQPVWYVAWEKGDDLITLDGMFSFDDLEAISWWVRNKGET